MEGIPRKAKILCTIGTFALVSPVFFSIPFPQIFARHDHPEKTVIITGATGNLGVAMTHNLSLKKVRVIMACRNMEKCKQIRREIVMLTNNKAIACRHLDLEDIDSINKFADEIIKTEPHIDVLINNAAVKDVKTRELTKYGIEKNFFVNFLGPYLLTLRLLDKLKESAKITRDSRIINVIGKPKSSWFVDLNDINFERRKYSSKAAYRQSKMALSYFTILLEEFNRRDVNFVHVYGTNLIYKNFTESIYWPVGVMEQASNIMRSYIKSNPHRAVNITLKCAIDPTLASSSGLLYSYFGRSWGWGAAGRNPKLARLVWNRAAQMLLDIPDKPINSNDKAIVKTETKQVVDAETK